MNLRFRRLVGSRNFFIFKLSPSREEDSLKIIFIFLFNITLPTWKSNILFFNYLPQEREIVSFLGETPLDNGVSKPPRRFPRKPPVSFFSRLCFPTVPELFHIFTFLFPYFPKWGPIPKAGQPILVLIQRRTRLTSLSPGNSQNFKLMQITFLFPCKH